VGHSGESCGLALGATLAVGAPALIARSPVLLPAQVRWPLILTRVLTVTFTLAVAAVCPRYATALLVGSLTRNLQPWQEAFRLGGCS